ncbi:3-hydroxybutyryl-CoA dehydrogenase [bacterium]|nr:3-hydroxybutyryl-CoA dehydrogenase [bacterium]
MPEENLTSLTGEKNGDTVNIDDVDRLIVVGAGTMGRGIAIASARRGIEVLLIEANENALTRSLEKVSGSLDQEITRWAMTESEKKAIISRIKGVVDFSEISDQLYVIEALPENLTLKMEIFRELDKYCVPEAILITNTSTLSITELASATERADRVIGMHFLNPVPKVRLIEIVRGLNTSVKTFHMAMVLAEKLERTAIEVFESPGYVTTRVMLPLINEAIEVLMEGVATAEDIDTAMQVGFDLARGPLTMADSIGLDHILSWMETLFHNLGAQKYRPCPLLRMLVRAGHLGVKTGQGFFRYDEEGNMISGSGQTSAAYERYRK